MVVVVMLGPRPPVGVGVVVVMVPPLPWTPDGLSIGTRMARSQAVPVGARRPHRYRSPPHAPRRFRQLGMDRVEAVAGLPRPSAPTTASPSRWKVAPAATPPRPSTSACGADDRPTPDRRRRSRPAPPPTLIGAEPAITPRHQRAARRGLEEDAGEDELVSLPARRRRGRRRWRHGRNRGAIARSCHSVTATPRAVANATIRQTASAPGQLRRRSARMNQSISSPSGGQCASATMRPSAGGRRAPAARSARIVGGDDEGVALTSVASSVRSARATAVPASASRLAVSSSAARIGGRPARAPRRRAASGRATWSRPAGRGAATLGAGESRSASSRLAGGQQAGRAAAAGRTLSRAGGRGRGGTPASPDRCSPPASGRGRPRSRGWRGRSPQTTAPWAPVEAGHHVEEVVLPAAGRPAERDAARPRSSTGPRAPAGRGREADHEIVDESAIFHGQDRLKLARPAAGG